MSEAEVPSPDITQDGLASLRGELATLTTESVDGAMGDLDLRETEELVLSMNDQDALVPAAVRAATPAIVRAVDGITERMLRGGRLIYAGAGTSGRLGVLDASECPPTFDVPPGLVVGLIAGGDTALRNAVEQAEDAAAQGRAAVAEVGLGPEDVLVGIAASGRTPYVVGALTYGREVGALTVALACNEGSRTGEIADIPIEVVVGPEFVAGSTRLKSGTAQKLVLNMLSTLAMVRLGKTYGNVMIDLRVTNEKLRARAQRTVMSVTGHDVDQVSRALDAAGGSVKVATLMLLAGLDADQARRRLEATRGFLRAALDQSAGTEAPSGSVDARAQ